MGRDCLIQVKLRLSLQSKGSAMLVIFKSPASGDVIMFGEVGKKMLEIMGKDKNDAKGIITLTQLPDAIARLRAAVDADKQAHQAQLNQEDLAEEDIALSTKLPAVSLTQRAIPLLELLNYSLKEEVPVTWGV
jgi:hypothetical protein